MNCGPDRPGRAWTCEFWLKPASTVTNEAVVFEMGMRDAQTLRSGSESHGLRLRGRAPEALP